MTADATGNLLSDMEGAFSKLSEASLPDAVFYETLSKLEQWATTFRVDATHFLNSDETAGFKEALIYDAKRHIHTDLGRILNDSRACLAGKSEGSDSASDAGAGAPTKAREELVAEWQAVLSSLRTGDWRAEKTDAKEEITKAAEAAGVEATFVSEVPGDEESLRVYIKDAAAKILAAVRGGETTVTI